MFNYVAKFNLTDEIKEESFDEARAYLLKDDMTQHVPENLKAKISSVEWRLEELDRGVVAINANERLSEEEENALSEWIARQCSYGLGEGFEEQPFAEMWSFYDYEDEEDEYYDDEYYHVYFSRKDKYKLILV